MRRSPWFLLAGMMLMMGLADGASAYWVEGSGQAVIRDGNVDQARETARNRALRDASLQFQAHVRSSDRVERGVVRSSRLSVDSSARARRVIIVSESRHGPVEHVLLKADMVAAGQSCSLGQGNRYRKRVAVAGFALLVPEEAAFGGLGNADRGLPQALYLDLVKSGSMQPFAVTRRQLFADTGDAPTLSEPDNSLRKSLALARQMNVQFVVSGVIRDMSLSDPDAWGSSIIDHIERGVGLKDRRRRLVVDLFVHDGFSGALVDEKEFAMTAKWNLDQDLQVGFGTEAFWNSDYGRATARLVKRMGDEVLNAIACQPFMVRITRVDNHRVYLAAGAASGIRPGDRLKLYRSYSAIDDPGTMPELEDTHRQVKITAVNPEFSSGKINIGAGRINLQRSDIALVW